MRIVAGQICGVLMGALSQLAADKDEAIQAARIEWLEAFAEYTAFLDTHDINRRTMEEIDEASRLESVCMWAKYRFEKCDRERYKIS